ncbi:MAG TPA: nitrilase-related carbon-nitrogen hydrolase [Alphaproteobacteria bacterium]|nr:nitrilase-related carbon-nitrogen hydrolase [Alphaproteobacteria bacterium]
MRIGLVQMKSSMKRDENLDRAEAFVADAAGRGARVVCLQECFATWFFPQRLNPDDQGLAEPIDGVTVSRMRAVARKLKVVLVVPFYERAMPGELYNSAAIVDAAGEILGLYRKHHIPMSARFNEKFYFRPGNKGFPVFETTEGRIGVMICYDRHFPESARMLGLGGAEAIFVPTAACSAFARKAWEVELRGHAIANGVFVAGVNRVGVEYDSTYFGASVVIDPIGEIIAQASETAEETLVVDLDQARLEAVRKVWPFYRDRRPDAYGRIVAP